MSAYPYFEGIRDNAIGGEYYRPQHVYVHRCLKNFYGTADTVANNDNELFDTIITRAITFIRKNYAGHLVGAKNMITNTKLSFKNMLKFVFQEPRLPVASRLRSIAQTAYIMLLCYKSEFKPHFMMASEKKDEFFSLFPEFADYDFREKMALQEFYSIGVVVKYILGDHITAKKRFFLDLVISICQSGSFTRLITGGGQSKAVDDRCLIYHRLTGVKLKHVGKHAVTIRKRVDVENEVASEILAGMKRQRCFEEEKQDDLFEKVVVQKEVDVSVAVATVEEANVEVDISPL